MFDDFPTLAHDLVPKLWIALAVAAALAQTVRNALAKRISERVSPALNSWSRFAFCLPYAAIACAWFAPEGLGFAAPPAFFGYCLITAVTQLLGNVALIAAFRRGGFGESIVFHKLEVILTALFGALVFAEHPSVAGAVGILVASKLGGYLFDNWQPAGPFILFGVLALVVLVWALLVKSQIRPVDQAAAAAETA